MKAILKNGLIQPKEPVPSDWSDGTELEVQKSASGTSDIETRFRRLKAQWLGDTLVLSDPNKIMGHAAMRAIIALGEAVVPLILRDLRDDPSWLVWALPEITGENLAPPKIEGSFAKWNMNAQIDAWLTWGRAKGLV